MGTRCEGREGDPDRKQSWEPRDKGCWGLTHMGVEGEVEVLPELLGGAATPVLKHVQIGLALELGGRSRAP